MGFLEHSDTFCRKRKYFLQQCCYLHASPPGNRHEISTNYEIGKSGHDDPVNTQPQSLPVKARRLSPDFINENCLVYDSTKFYASTQHCSFCLFLDRKELR